MQVYKLLHNSFLHIYNVGEKVKNKNSAGHAKRRKTFIQHVTKGNYMLRTGSLFNIIVICFVLFIRPKNNYEFCADISASTNTVPSSNNVSENTLQIEAHGIHSSSYEVADTDISNETVKETVVKFLRNLFLYHESYASSSSKPWLNDNGNQITPVIRVATNFSKSAECNKRYVPVGDPFLTFKDGYKMVLSICPSGCNCGDGTHLSLYIHLMKGPHDDELEQSGRWPLSGLLKFELLNQFSDECHYVADFLLDETVCNKSTKRVEGDKEFGCECGIHEFIPLPSLNNTIYLQNDRLYFRITYKQYLSSFSMINFISEHFFVLKLSVYNSLIVFVLLVFMEYVSFCFIGIVLVPNITDHYFSISSIINFLLAKKHVLLHTAFIALCRALRNFLAWITLVTLCLMLIAFLEMMQFNLHSTMVMAGFFSRIGQVMMWSWTIEVYAMSWGRNIPLFGPMWIIHLFKLNFLKICNFVYMELWNLCLTAYICSILLQVTFKLFKKIHL